MLSNTTINAELFREMIHSGAMLLEQHRQEVDSLNVFPVPDGDTGTNMAMTMRSTLREVSQEQGKTVGELANAMARGALKGARGNSGVILSQLFRGFAKGVQGMENIGTREMANAFNMGVDMAYKAIMKPREGTILTVSRGFAQGALEAAEENDDLVAVMRAAMQAGQATLAKTPDMLEVLKQAGVVDSGGKGLLYVYEGWLCALTGEEVSGEMEDYAAQTPAEVRVPVSAAAGSEQEIVFGYCTELIVVNLRNVTDEDVERLKGRLSIIGDSLVVVCDGEVIKIHVHTNMPGKVLQYALRMGDLTSIKVENMREQHSNLLQDMQPQDQPKKPFGMVTVAAGEGNRAIFMDLQCNGFVEGGQTMNPSTEDILKAIEAENADCVFVFPNNSNIILAAQQTVELAGCRVFVIPTKSMPQGVAAVLAFNPELSGEENARSMTEAMARVKTGSVTFAVRDSAYKDMTIHDGDIMGMKGSEISALGHDPNQVAMELVADMMEDEEIITVYYGHEATEEMAEKLRTQLEEAYPDCDVEMQFGGQPLYYYIISLE